MDISESIYSTILDHVADGVYFLDTERKISYWNSISEKITGYTSQEVLGRSCADNILKHTDCNGRHLCKTACPVAAVMEDQAPHEADIFLLHKDGHRVPVHVRAFPVTNTSGQVVGAVECYEDLSPKNALIEKARDLRDAALLNPDTGLANRIYAEMTLRSWLHAHATEGWSFGVILMEIRHFAKFRSLYGPDNQKRILAMTSRTLLNCAKTYDLVGHWSDDHLIALIAGVSEGGLNLAAKTFTNMVAANRVTEDSVLQIGLLTGTTLVAEADSPASLIDRASKALQRAVTRAA